jgi:hypothetical protein
MIREAIAGTRPSEEMSRIVAALKTLDDMTVVQEFNVRLAEVERRTGVPAATRAERLWR